MFKRILNKRIKVSTMSQCYTAFTLAETLITMTIIGVVAAMVIPVTMQNIQARAWSEQKENFEMKINEAMNQMKTNEVLTGYSTSEAFVTEFNNYMKITNTCDSSKLTNCFVPNFKTASGVNINTISELKTGVDFGKTTYTSPLVGVQFINGIQGIVAYNPICPYVDPYDNQAVATNCLSMVYDLNGTSKPNVIGKDIYTYSATITGCDGSKFAGLCISANIITLPSGTLYTCDDGTAENKQYDPTGSSNIYCATNRFAVASRACMQNGMRLPTLQEVKTIGNALYNTTLTDYWNSGKTCNTSHELGYLCGHTLATSTTSGPSAISYFPYGTSPSLYGTNKGSVSGETRCVK